MMTIFEQISNEYYTLTSSEKKTADYVMAHRKETPSMSIGDLSSECGVAEATISRFCRKLGCKNFNAFKLAVASASVGKLPNQDMLSGEISTEDSFEIMAKKIYQSECTVIQSTMDLLNEADCLKAVDMFIAADRVLCMGQGGSMLIAEETTHLFSTVCSKFYAIWDSHLQALSVATMTPGDLILFFSYSGATRDLIELIHQAKGQKVKVILITRFPKSPGAQLADLVLRCGASENPLQLGSVAAKISQMFLMEILFSEYCRRDMDAARNNRRMIADALAEKHM